ncbi:GNAT family N-acetyltransferase [Streptomyces sp. NRRL F-2890]|uniref:GNAT family N-acetyltransferase n=1 Tax=Streptomyces sp. NRRL F-2890 TaxID=1463845 RepID=UPI00069356F4|nr:GNAT family N-acetyltransferase [Streptomyces sp. NRRL F-2890]
MTGEGRIRAADAGELERLREIERAAGEPFRALGMAAVADDEPPSHAVLDGYRRRGRLWVWDTGAGEVGGYLLADEVDGAVHIEQVSVHPDRARRGIGRALIDAAAQPGVPQTLTTFTQVPWNAPYYARLGFREVPARELTPGLRAIRAHEAELGLDRWPRICMRRPGGRAAPAGGGPGGAGDAGRE